PAKARLDLATHHAVEATDLREVMGDALPDRNRVAGALLAAVPDVLSTFEVSGFGPFQNEWRQLDAVHGNPVRLIAGDRVIRGVAQGVAGDGALLLDTGIAIERYVSGELSLRVDRT
ncbi:MAG TPA: hypothetical protein VLT59_17380, partial [Steroidobacteraceae bacterium]|nr:hypothetical protein [Steroidobacteraceae bacterium]